MNLIFHHRFLTEIAGDVPFPFLFATKLGVLGASFHPVLRKGSTIDIRISKKERNKDVFQIVPPLETAFLDLWLPEK